MGYLDLKFTATFTTFQYLNWWIIFPPRFWPDFVFIKTRICIIRVLAPGAGCLWQGLILTGGSFWVCFDPGFVWMSHLCRGISNCSQPVTESAHNNVFITQQTSFPIKRLKSKGNGGGCSMFNGDILVGKGKIMSKLFWKILFWSICHPLVAWCVPPSLHD